MVCLLFIITKIYRHLIKDYRFFFKEDGLSISFTDAETRKL